MKVVTKRLFNYLVSFEKNSATRAGIFPTVRKYSKKKKGTMKAGLASVDITPTSSLPIGGNPREDNWANGIHDRLRANIIVLKKGSTRLSLIGLDLLGILRKDCEKIKNTIVDEIGIERENILISATHTHSGPNVVKLFLQNSKEVEAIDQYRNNLVERVVRGVKIANDGLFECQIGWGKGKEPRFSFNRRVFTKDGSLKMVFEDFDRENLARLAGVAGHPDLNVLTIRDKNEQLRGLFVNYTTHLTTLCGEGLLYSRDFVNYFTESLQEEYGKDLVVCYTTGAQGNMVPSDPRNNFVTGFSESKRVGRKLGETTKVVINRIQKLEGSFDSITREIELPLRKISSERIQKAKNVLKKSGQSRREHGLDPQVEARELLKVARIPRDYENTVIQAISIGNRIFLGLPGEVFLELGLEIVNNFQDRKIVLIGLANDYIGYIPTSEAFNQGGYEVKTARSSRYDENAGRILVRETVDLIKSM